MDTNAGATIRFPVMGEQTATAGGTQAPPRTVPSGRPGWLTFFAVTAIVVGAMIAVTTASELGSERLLTAQRALMVKSDQLAPNPALQAQLDMQARLAGAMKIGHDFLAWLAPLGLLTAVGLIVGGIGCLQLRPRARTILLAALAVALVHEGARVKPAIERQLAVAQITQSSMTEMIGAAARRPSPSGDGARAAEKTQQTVQQLAGTAAMFASLAGLATAIAVVVLKLAFLGSGLVYLTRPRVRALFG